MRALHLCFRLHRPYKLNSVAEFDKGYFGGEAEFREANRLEYQPFFALLERNAQRHKKLKVSLSVSGIWLEQAIKWDPELIRRLRRLVQNGVVEILAMPFDYSLASFYSMEEFATQMAEFRDRAGQLFGAECRILAMPELIYHDQIGAWAEEAGMAGALLGAAEAVLDYRTPNKVYALANDEEFSVEELLQGAGRKPAKARAKVHTIGVEASGDAKALARTADTRAFGLLCQNTRFSRAILQKGRLATTVRVGAKEEFEDEQTSEVPNVAPRARRATAAEFVKGMAAAAKPVERAAARKKMRVNTDGELVFSAPKFQKELEIEMLRGELVNLCLDTAIFRAWRDDGIVRFFDELFGGWLKVPGHRFVDASEAVELGLEGVAKLSVKTTVDWRGDIGGDVARGKDIDERAEAGQSGDGSMRVGVGAGRSGEGLARDERGVAWGLALLKDLRYCPPRWLSSARQVKMEKTLYGLRERVLTTKNADLYRIFGRLTDLSYIVALNPEVPELVRGVEDKNTDGWLDEDAGMYGRRVEKVWESFEKQVEDALPKPAKLTAKAGEDGPEEVKVKRAGGKGKADEAKGEASDDAQAGADNEEEDFSVKVHRVAKKATSQRAKVTPGRRAGAEVAEGPEVVDDLEAADDAEVDDDLAVKVHIGQKRAPAQEEDKEINLGRRKAPAQKKSAAARRGGNAKKPARRIVVEEAEEWDEVVWSEAFDEQVQDEAEAEVQAIASRLSRQREKITENVSELVEGEVVETPAPKKRKRFVLE